MPWTTVAAVNRETGEYFATKRALRIALRTKPEMVTFQRTSELDLTDLPNRFHIDMVATYIRLSVCGPDAWHNRQWFAVIEKRIDGKLVVR